jgi:hypothetical protein
MLYVVLFYTARDTFCHDLIFDKKTRTVQSQLTADTRDGSDRIIIYTIRWPHEKEKKSDLLFSTLSRDELSSNNATGLTPLQRDIVGATSVFGKIF